MSDFDISVKFAEALAQTNQSFIDFSNKLRSRPRVLDVKSGMECRKYGGKLVIETYAEAELENDSCICWWLEIVRHEGEWEVSASILRNADSGQETLKEFTGSSAKSVAELESALNEQINSAFLDVTFC